MPLSDRVVYKLTVKLFHMRVRLYSVRLAQAIQRKDYTKINFLLTEKAKYIDRYYKDRNGNTFVHMAASEPYLSGTVMVQLHDFGCPVDAKNLAGETPTACASYDWQVKKLRSLTYSVSGWQTKREQRLEAITKQTNIYRDGSRLHAGRYRLYNLDLCYGSKNGKPHKTCVVPDRWEKLDAEDGLNLTLHQRLAIAEAFLSSQTTSPQQIFDADSVNNHVTANIGFVVSTKPHAKGGDHGRKFITIPLIDLTYLTIRYKPANPDQERQHSEEGLYYYLSLPENLTRIIHSLWYDFGITKGHKIYAIVLDLHSTNAMCRDCEDTTYRLQASHSNGWPFVATLEQLLQQCGYILPKKKTYTPDILTPSSRRLHVVTRVSASLPYSSHPRPGEMVNNRYTGYTYPEFDGLEPPVEIEASIKVAGEITLSLQIGASGNIAVGFKTADKKQDIADNKEEKRVTTNNQACYFTRDVRRFHNAVVIHGHTSSLIDKARFSRFRDKETYASLAAEKGFLAMYRQTTFVNYYRYRNFNSKQRDEKENATQIQRVELKKS